MFINVRVATVAVITAAAMSVILAAPQLKVGFTQKKLVKFAILKINEPKIVPELFISRNCHE
jgi:hypothetical protein